MLKCRLKMLVKFTMYSLTPHAWRMGGDRGACTMQPLISCLSVFLQKGWETTSDNSFVFKQKDHSKLEPINSVDLAQQAIHYARELEMIIWGPVSLVNVSAALIGWWEGSSQWQVRWFLPIYIIEKVSLSLYLHRYFWWPVIGSFSNPTTNQIRANKLATGSWTIIFIYNVLFGYDPCIVQVYRFTLLWLW